MLAGMDLNLEKFDAALSTSWPLTAHSLLVSDEEASWFHLTKLTHGLRNAASG